MTNLEKAMNQLTDEVKKYRQCDYMDGETLISILQQITGILFYLEKERSEYHDKFQTIIQGFIIDGATVSRAENQAHKLVPEMYMLRHIMSSAYEVVGAIRTTISWLKSEKHNSL